MTPILPFASRPDLLAELTEIREERDRIVGEICPERARELRENLAWWERELLEQLEALSEPEAEADKGADTPAVAGSVRTPSDSLSASRGAL